MTKSNASLSQQLNDLIAEVTQGWQHLTKKLSDIPGNHMKLGQSYLAEGNADEAVMRFKIVTWMRAKDAEGWAWLAKAAAIKGDKDKAKTALATLTELAPTHPMHQEVETLLNAPPPPAEPEKMEETAQTEAAQKEPASTEPAKPTEPNA